MATSSRRRFLMGAALLLLLALGPADGRRSRPYCTDSVDCIGYENSFCSWRRCKCLLSYWWTPTYSGCLPEACDDSNIERRCDKIWKNTVCVAEQCECAPGYEWDPDSGGCATLIEYFCRLAIYGLLVGGMVAVYWYFYQR